MRVKSILVPVDFSPPSMKALDYAVNLAGAIKARITLLHVVETIAVPEFASYPVMMTADARSQSTLAELTNIAKQHGCGAALLRDVRVRKGTPYYEITNAARALKVDLIILATHGYTGVKHVLLGSTAERVVRYARCPVLVVPARS